MLGFVRCKRCNINSLHDFFSLQISLEEKRLSEEKYWKNQVDSRNEIAHLKRNLQVKYWLLFPHIYQAALRVKLTPELRQ